MNESGQVYKYNKLRTIRTLTDIISQCIVAFAFSAFVILGLTNKSDSYIIATLLMAVPVIITYVARKNIHKNFLFMLIHAALLITAISSHVATVESPLEGSSFKNLLRISTSSSFFG
jgi:predicted neutral ceramidase superfamily lipid hydrolase